MGLDLDTWLEFLNHYNGITLFPERLSVSSDTLLFFTDSAGGRSGGFGIFFHNKWAFGKWPKHWLDSGRLRDITYLALFAIVVAVSVIGQPKDIVLHR